MKTIIIPNEEGLSQVLKGIQEKYDLASLGVLKLEPSTGYVLLTADTCIISSSPVGIYQVSIDSEDILLQIDLEKVVKNILTATGQKERAESAFWQSPDWKDYEQANFVDPWKKKVETPPINYIPTTFKTAPYFTLLENLLSGFCTHYDIEIPLEYQVSLVLDQTKGLVLLTVLEIKTGDFYRMPLGTWQPYDINLVKVTISKELVCHTILRLIYPERANSPNWHVDSLWKQAQ